MVVGPVTRECMDVIREIASEKGATVQAFGEDFSLVEESYQDSSLTIPLEQLALQGAFQKERMRPLRFEHFVRGWKPLEEVHRPNSSRQLYESFHGQDAWKCYKRTPLVMIDGAHNLPAIERLVQNMTAGVGKKQTLLFSALTRKDSQQMLLRLQEALPDVNIILTSFHPSKDCRLLEVMSKRTWILARFPMKKALKTSSTVLPAQQTTRANYG